MLRPLGTFWMHIYGLSPLRLGPMPCWLVLVPQCPMRSVGIVVPQARFVAMGTTAQALVLVCMTPMWWATPRCLPSLTLVLMQPTCCRSGRPVRLMIKLRRHTTTPNSDQCLMHSRLVTTGSPLPGVHRLHGKLMHGVSWLRSMMLMRSWPMP